MDWCGLFLTGKQDIDADDIIADNITILSNLSVSRTTNLNTSLNIQSDDILIPINNLNYIIYIDS
jgi:hypothetical protein